MNTSMRKIVLLSTLAGLPALAFAQVANTAATVTGATRLNNVPPAPPVVAPPAAPRTPPAPSVVPPSLPVQANAAAQSATAAGATVHTPIVTPGANAAANSAAGAHAGAGTSASGLNSSAASNASVNGQTHGLSTASTVGQNATVMVNPTVMSGEIQSATFHTRKELAANIDARIDASMRAVNSLRARADAAGDKSREEFARALVEVRAREKALRASLKESTKATGESAWGEVQSKLAKDYGDYAQAVASAEAAAQGSAAVSETPKS